MDFQKDITQRILELEREVDRLKRSSAWEDWTPVITQSVDVTFTTDIARYTIIGDLAIFWARLDVTGAGTAGQPITITGMDSIAYPNDITGGTSGLAGIGEVRHGAGATVEFGALVKSTSGFRIVTSGVNGFVGALPSFALASGDVVALLAVFERS